MYCKGYEYLSNQEIYLLSIYKYIIKSNNEIIDTRTYNILIDQPYIETENAHTGNFYTDSSLTNLVVLPFYSTQPQTFYTEWIEFENDGSSFTKAIPWDMVNSIQIKPQEYTYFIINLAPCQLSFFILISLDPQN